MQRGVLQCKKSFSYFFRLSPYIWQGGAIKLMPKVEQKQVVINEIKEKLAKATSVVMVNSRGLTVEQDTVLRKKLRESGIEYKVYKNTMVNLAVDDTQFDGLKPFLKGPSAFAFVYDDTNAAGIFSKEMKAMPKLELKAGFVGDITYDAAGIKAIADIPSREVLLSKLLGSFKSPMASFARVVNAIAEKPAEAEAEAEA